MSEEKKDLDVKDYTAFYGALVEIQSGIRNDDYGICFNVLAKTRDVVEHKFVYMFLQRAMKDILGSGCGQYPIEGTYEAFKANTLKWCPLSEHGNKRLYLLKGMTDYAECKMLELQEKMQNV